MKKTVITLLLILPFVLIYFISFTGQILAKYTHINVERVVVLDANGNEYKEDDYIIIDKGETYKLEVKIYPELASNKEYSISNSNNSICTISDDNCVLGLDYGVSKLIITSIDSYHVQFVINIFVCQDEIQDIILNKTQLEIKKGYTEYVEATIYPSTTIMENRNLIWSSEDETIATVKDGYIRGIGLGTTKIYVRSDHKDLTKEIIVTVTNNFGKGVFFDYDDVGTKILQSESQSFDLKSITIINLDGVTFDDVYYSLDTNNGASLTGGIINFVDQKRAEVVSVHAEKDGIEYSSEITIWWNESLL